MNKIVLLSAVFIAITAASCKKERSCECTNTETRVTTYNSGNVTTDTDITTTKVTSEKHTKKYFRTHANCYSYTDVRNETGGSYTRQTTTNADCTLR